jgi:hypothetical protein
LKVMLAASADWRSRPPPRLFLLTTIADCGPLALASDRVAERCNCKEWRCSLDIQVRQVVSGRTGAGRFGVLLDWDKRMTA